MKTILLIITISLLILSGCSDEQINPISPERSSAVGLQDTHLPNAHPINVVVWNRGDKQGYTCDDIIINNTNQVHLRYNGQCGIVVLSDLVDSINITIER